MNKIFLLLYYSLFSKLPSSYFPFGNLFNDLRVNLLKRIIPIGLNTKIQKNVYIGNGSNISIGNNCQINENIKLDNVQIGNYVMIAPGVTVLGKMHAYHNISIPMVMQGEKKQIRSIIEEDVWIGTNAIIMPGLIIKKGVIIGAGSVVTKDCDEYGIYGGVPAQLIKERK